MLIKSKTDTALSLIPSVYLRPHDAVRLTADKRVLHYTEYMLQYNITQDNT